METSKEPEKLRRRYTSLEKLTTLLEEVFAEGTASIEIERDHILLKAPRQLTPEPDDVVRDKLACLRVRAPGSTFLPNQTLDKTLEYGVISQLISGYTFDRSKFSLEDMCSRVHDHLKKTFAILLYVHAGHLIPNFVSKTSFSDHNLPLGRADLEKYIPKDQHRSKRDQFYVDQWMFDAPVLKERQHGCFEEEVQMPFLDDRRLPSSSQGQNGVVSVVTIPLSHLKRKEDEDTLKVATSSEHGKFRTFGSIPRLKVIRKKLDPYTADTQELEIHRDLKHASVVPFYTSYSHGAEDNILLQRCDMTMAEFLRQEDPAQHWPDEVTYYTAVRDLSKAISALHTYRQNNVIPVDSIGCHHDLKPDNVLVDLSARKFLLTDFGLSTVTLPVNGSNARFPGQLSDYVSPEAVKSSLGSKDQHVGRKSDIWSFGCILAELVVYLEASGARTLTHFRSEREIDITIGYLSMTCYFFHALDDTNPRVWARLDHVHRESSSKARRYLVGLIRSMLALDQGDRPRIEKVTEELSVASEGLFDEHDDCGLNHDQMSLTTGDAAPLHIRQQQAANNQASITSRTNLPSLNTAVSSPHQLHIQSHVPRSIPQPTRIVNYQVGWIWDAVRHFIACYVCSIVHFNAPVPTEIGYARLKESSDQIRLCTLQPGQGDEPLDFSLDIVSLGTAPPFEALSYTWKGDSCLAAVRLAARSLALPSNVTSAMFHLRRPDMQRIIWVDRLCIDHKHSQEKSHQVGMMGEIYVRATQVLLWLGEPAQYAASGLYKISEFGQHQRARKSAGSPSTSEISITDVDSRILEGVLCRPYFHRAWTIQELARARTIVVHCGVDSIPWQDFIDAALYLRHAPLERIHPFRPHFRCIWNVTRAKPNTSLFTLLSNTFRSSHYECELDHDRVYALLSLVPSQDRLEVDYNISISDLYINVVVEFIDNYQRLAIFSQIQEQQRSRDLPSWVPDWRVDRVTTSINLHETGESFSRFYATSKSTQRTKYRASNKLKLKGFFFDTVSKLVSSFPREASVTGTQAFSDWVANTDPSRTKYDHTEEDIQIAYFRTLSTDQGPLSWRIDLRSINTYYPEYRKWLGDAVVSEASSESELDASSALTKIRGGRGSTSLPTPEMPHELHQEIWSEVKKQRTPARKVFHTTNGFIGLGPRDMRFNDKIYLLFGGSVPYVLRPKDKHSYRLVGECYIHGIMDGERYERMDADEIQEITLI